jgi:hypothetical protein
MPRRLRDAAGTVLVLAVLFGVLMAASPAVRERVALFADGRSDEWAAPRQAASQALVATGSMAVRYAGANTYLVCFLIVAGLLFFLMLRT